MGLHHGLQARTPGTDGKAIVTVSQPGTDPWGPQQPILGL